MERLYTCSFAFFLLSCLQSEVHVASGLQVPENRPALLSPASFLVQVLVPWGLLSVPETCCQMSWKISYWGFNISEWNQLPNVIFLGVILSWAVASAFTTDQCVGSGFPHSALPESCERVMLKGNVSTERGAWCINGVYSFYGWRFGSRGLSVFSSGKEILQNI